MVKIIDNKFSCYHQKKWVKMENLPASKIIIHKQYNILIKIESLINILNNFQLQTI